MMKHEAIPALSLALVLGGCGFAQAPRPQEVMSVNCDESSKDASTISLNEIGGKTGASEIIIDVTDQKERKSVLVELVGRVAVDGHQIMSADAGKKILKLPTAELLAGVPAPNTDKYYAGDEGLTLKCDGATIADVRMNGN